MEQKYIDELKELGFVLDSVKLDRVLHSRAYHNKMGSITDTSYAEIFIPEFLDKKDEEKVQQLFMLILKQIHKKFVKITHWPVIGEGTRIDKNMIQLTFSKALTQEKITSEVFRLFDICIRTLEEYLVDHPEHKNKIDLVINRYKIIKVLINAGYNTYEYNVDSYSPLD